jgi:tetratricopeptide (TPR) repeat protein
MTEAMLSSLPRLTAEQRRVVAGQFERANQVITKGDYDYGIQLLLNCCKLDPASLTYRQALRQTEKSKYQNNMRGARLSFFKSFIAKRRLRRAQWRQDYLKVLEFGEQILVHNPWNVGVLIAMAKAFDALLLLDPALWTLDQARQKDPNDPKINRFMARLCEKRGNFVEAMGLWALVRKADPKDKEAEQKTKDLAANATIARGRYDEVIHKGEDKALAETAHEHGPAAQTQPSLTPAEERLHREVTALRARIKSDPTNTHPYLQLASAYRRADQFEKAREVLQEGLGPTGNHFELALMLADLDIEPFRRNLAAAEERLRRHADDENLKQIKARLVKEINTRELALLREKAARFPVEMTYRFEMGLRLLALGQIDEAIRELQSARTDPRLLGKSLLYLGYCFKNRKNWRLAERNFEEALQHLPPHEEGLRKEVMFQLATGFAEAGDLNRAIEQGYELANLDFGYNNIGRLLDDWQTQLQKA